MTLIGEVAEAIKTLGDVVKSTRELAEAVKDGHKFLAREHPEAQKDLLQMLAEMRKTVKGLATVTGVVTSFKFTTTGAGVDFEPARFNTYVIAHKEKVEELRGRLSSLKGSCDKIRDARDKLEKLAKGDNDWVALFVPFNAARQDMNARLAGILSNFYADDQRMLELVEQMVDLCQAALDEADAALGPPGTASHHHVETAASVLGVYAAAFKQSEAELRNLVDKLDDAIRGFQ